jgi:hypothetical protein
MKHLLTIIFVLVFSLSVFGQIQKLNALPKDYVQLSITDDGPTSELLLMPVGRSPNLIDAQIGIKYFGVKSDSDISFVLLLKGTKFRYSTGESFGVQLSVDDDPINSNRFRLVEKVAKDGNSERIHFYLTTEDLAWLATGQKLKIAIFNTDTEIKLDTLFLTPTNFQEFKRFVKSVYLIRSKFNN